MFVVSETGQPDLATLRVLSATNERFAESVRSALQRTRFVPAQKDGAAVRQVVQHTDDFGLAGDPGVRVEGMALLRNITAGHVEYVRYWKREEAAMQFGMEYPYAVTVKLRPDRS